MRKERFMIPKVRIRERFLGTKSVRKVTTRGESENINKNYSSKKKNEFSNSKMCSKEWNEISKEKNPNENESLNRISENQKGFRGSKCERKESNGLKESSLAKSLLEIVNTKILESGNNGQNGSSENDRELIEFNRCLG